MFYAYVEFLEDSDYRNLTKEELLAIVPRDYNDSLPLCCRQGYVISPDFPILAVDFVEARSFRTISSRIQSIENNLSIANMDFEEFAKSVDEDGIFRGFPKA